MRPKEQATDRSKERRMNLYREQYPHSRYRSQEATVDLINKDMSLETVIEKLIEEAMARGEFDNLEGHGMPLDLTAYFNTPEELRMAYSLLKSSKFIPDEVDLIRQIADL